MLIFAVEQVQSRTCLTLFTMGRAPLAMSLGKLDLSYTDSAILRFICIIIQNYAKHSGKKFFFFKKTYYFCILDHMNKTKYFRILRLNYHYVRRTSES